MSTPLPTEVWTNRENVVTQSSSSQQQLNEFKAALARGEITQAQYNMAVAYQQQQTQQPLPTQNWVRPVEPAKQQAPEPLPTVLWENRVVNKASTSPLPAEPNTMPYVVQGSFVLKGSQVTPILNEQNQVTAYQITPPKDYYIKPQLQLSTPQSLEPTPSMSYGGTPATEKWLTSYPSGTIPPSERFQYQNLSTQEQAVVRQALLEDALTIATPFAFAVAPVPALVGTVLSPVVTQAIKFTSGDGWLSPQELKLSAMGGAVFSAVGAGVVGTIGATSGSLVHIGARVATSTVLGAGVGTGYEWVSTGQVTGEGAVTGAAYGLAFGLIAEGTRIGYGIAKTKAQQTLSESYVKTLETGELWKPTFKEQVLMKLTGAKPDAPFVKLKATEMLTDSYIEQARANQQLLNTDGYSKTQFGSTLDLETKAALTQMQPQGQTWTPTVKQIEIMALTGAKPQLSSGIVAIKGIGADPVSFGMLKAGAVAGDAFDIAFAPKTSLYTRYDVAPKVTPATYTKLPLYFGIGQDLINFKEYFDSETKPLQQTTQEPYTNEPLSFTKPKMYYDTGQHQYVSYDAVAKPTQQQSGSMKPLWESQGAKTDLPSTYYSDLKPTQSILQPKNVMAKQATGNIPEATTIGLTAKQAALIQPKLIPTVYPMQPQKKTETQSFIEQQATNPFTQVKGKQYYPQKVIAEEEDLVLSYPQSGLQQPALMQQPTTKEAQFVRQPEILLPTMQFKDQTAQKQKSIPTLTYMPPLIKPIADIGQPFKVDIGLRQGQGATQSQHIISSQLQKTILEQTPINTPVLIEATTPKFIEVPPEQTMPFSDNIFKLPSGKFESTTPTTISLPRKGSKSKRIRLYPVVDPTTTAEALY